MPNIMQGKLPKISRISKSRDGWKTKAKRRGAKVREARKRAEANRKKRAADKQEMRRLREKVAALSKSLEVQGLLPAPPGARLETSTTATFRDLFNNDRGNGVGFGVNLQPFRSAEAVSSGRILSRNF